MRILFIELEGKTKALAVSSAFVTALSACNTTGGADHEGIGFRQARFAEVTAMRQYRDCRDEALGIDEQARQDGSPARYLASAKLIEKCESKLGPDAAGVAVDERFRTYALAVQNHLKGGDVARAREDLEKLKQAFPDRDLYLADGSSFIDTLEVLLGMDEQGIQGQFALTNVSGELKTEIRRMRYWKRN